MPDSRKGNWPKVAIGGLVLLNLVLLVALALRDPSPTLAAVPAPPDGTTTTSRVSSPTSSPTQSPADSGETPTPTASPSASTPSPTSTSSSAGPVQSTRVLAANSDKLAWRAEFGPCPTDPKVEVSRDGGRTWRSTSVGLKSVTRLRSYSESSVFAVGGAKGCEARYVATGGPEESWGSIEGMLGETWYRVPEETQRVHAPGGRMSSPCESQLGDFAGLGDTNAAALCANGQVRLTQDSGRTWRDLKGGDAGLALNADDGVYALATRKAGCDGVAVTVLDPGVEQVNREKARCAPVDQVSAERLAVAVRGQVVWLWAGSDIAVSTNRGQSWDRT